MISGYKRHPILKTESWSASLNFESECTSGLATIPGNPGNLVQSENFQNVESQEVLYRFKKSDNFGVVLE